MTRFASAFPRAPPSTHRVCLGPSAWPNCDAKTGAPVKGYGVTEAYYVRGWKSSAMPLMQ